MMPTFRVTSFLRTLAWTESSYIHSRGTFNVVLGGAYSATSYPYVAYAQLRQCVCVYCITDHRREAQSSPRVVAFSF